MGSTFVRQYCLCVTLSPVDKLNPQSITSSTLYFEIPKCIQFQYLSHPPSFGLLV